MLYQIQYLRAVAVLAVIYFHLVEVLNARGFQIGNLWHDVGPVGVDLFFVISGFIMARIAALNDVKAGPFLLKRFWRIAPIYWAATLLVFCIAATFPSLLNSTTADPIQLLHSLLFIPNGQDASSSAPTLMLGWTLNYEMFFYGLVAIAAGLLSDRKLITVVITLLILTCSGWYFKPTNGYFEFYTDPIVLEFGFGVIIYHFWANQRLSRSVEYSILSIALMVAVIFFTRHSYLSDARPLFWGLPAAIIVFSAMNLNVGRDGYVKKIGDWSYELYIWHVFLIVGVVTLMTEIAQIDFTSVFSAVAYLMSAIIILVFFGIGMNVVFSPIRGEKFSDETDSFASRHRLP